ncbi:DNA-binding transcriptional LysR family regulator [Caballeronia udeis]|uniref:DNA-binding transcriptional LysR family regulator n=1 Tax=Caballeronia udeis TaxID=1232866 RepID=A0ABW8MT15_9BURK
MDRLTAMETFVCVVESGSFSAAARLLNVGQPAVSKSIAQLEERLAVRLLLRSTRGLTPTEAGHAFYERAKRAIEEADEAEAAARGSAGALSGRLRISAGVTFARIHILPQLQTFLDQHPELNIDIVLDDENIDLLERGIDVALRMGVLGDSNMTARKITHSRRCVVGTPAWFAKAGEPRVPADLLSHQAIVYEQGGGGSVWSFKQGNSETAIVVAGRVRVNAAEGVRATVLADMGVAIASEWMFTLELASGAVRRVLTDWELPGIDLWAVFPSGRMVSAKARAFVAWIEEMFGPQIEALPIEAPPSTNNV